MLFKGFSNRCDFLILPNRCDVPTGGGDTQTKEGANRRADRLTFSCWRLNLLPASHKMKAILESGRAGKILCVPLRA